MPTIDNEVKELKNVLLDFVKEQKKFNSEQKEFNSEQKEFNSNILSSNEGFFLLG